MIYCHKQQDLGHCLEQSLDSCQKTDRDIALTVSRIKMAPTSSLFLLGKYSAVDCIHLVPEDQPAFLCSCQQPLKSQEGRERYNIIGIQKSNNLNA